MSRVQVSLLVAQASLVLTYLDAFHLHRAEKISQREERRSVCAPRAGVCDRFAEASTCAARGVICSVPTFPNSSRSRLEQPGAAQALSISYTEVCDCREACIRVYLERLAAQPALGHSRFEGHNVTLKVNTHAVIHDRWLD